MNYAECSLSSNDSAKIRLFSDTTKFQREIRGDFQQNSIKTNVNKPNSSFREQENIELAVRKHRVDG